MAGKLYMKIVSPTGVCFDGDVLHASFPGKAGEFAVFPAHAPIISELREGDVRYALADNDRTEALGIKSGFVEVSNDEITVCVELSNAQ